MKHFKYQVSSIRYQVLHIIFKVVGIMLLVTCFMLPVKTFAQKEKRILREGNNSYFGGKYSEAEGYYSEALKAKNNYYKSNYNLGDAYYKQGKFTDAIGQYDTYIKNSTSNNKDTISKVFHNLGNSYLKTKSYNEAITAYKNSLKMNPKDEDTRYNLAYALKKLKEQQQKNKDKKDIIPSAYAKKMKAQADDLVKQHKFDEANKLINFALSKDQTVAAYNDFMKKLKDVVDINSSAK